MLHSRWFLAHKKTEVDTAIDSWCSRLQTLLASPGWDTAVVAGRDDYNLRARAMGGWQRWCDDVPAGCNWSGDPLFHGIVIPTDEASPVVGKATAALVAGFIQAQKYAFIWCPCTEQFSQIRCTDTLPEDNWQMWARLIPMNGKQ